MRFSLYHRLFFEPSVIFLKKGNLSEEISLFFFLLGDFIPQVVTHSDQGKDLCNLALLSEHWVLYKSF